MIGRGYDILHLLPGRIRLQIHKGLDLEQVSLKVEKLSGVTGVIVNRTINTLLVHFNANVVSHTKILEGINPTGCRTGKLSVDFKKDILWSLLAGGSLLAAYIYRRSHVQANTGGSNLLEYLAAGVTGYSVLTHRDIVTCGNKSLHLDTLAGLFSIFSLNSDKALMGMAITWLLNFLEIMFGWPKYSHKCN